MKLITPLIALAFVIGGLSFPLASASDINVVTKELYAGTEDAAMCDRNVTITTVAPDGVLQSVSVDGISSHCLGWMLRVRITDSSGAVIGMELARAVDSASETWEDLNIDVDASYQAFFVFDAPS